MVFNAHQVSTSNSGRIALDQTSKPALQINGSDCGSGGCTYVHGALNMFLWSGCCEMEQIGPAGTRNVTE